jgi:hypothetical protein
MVLITKSGEKRICREHRIAFDGRRCPKCEAFRRMVYEASIRALDHAKASKNRTA